MTVASEGLPDEAWAAALATLPGCSQQRLHELLRLAGHDARAAWERVLGGDHADGVAGAIGRGGAAIADRWRTAARRIDVPRAWSALAADGVGVWVEHGEGYPEVLADDPEPPPILFWRGDRRALDRPAVAIVGTRRCTAYGADVARSLGRDLAAAGIAVVSGLALGIDGAAHEGALAAGHVDGQRLDAADGPARATAPSRMPAGPPIGVVGSGLDVVYPPRHRALWRRVADHGLLLSEAPPGASPEPWRFPRRNRILAGLSTVVVVVESHATGGSLSTVRNAIDRGITVMAVPGSVRSPSSAGTNRLLADGVAPVTCADDVLTALALEGVTCLPSSSPSSSPPGNGAEGAGRSEGRDGDADSPVLAAVDWTPTATEDILRRTGLTLGTAATELARLEVEGRVRRRGAWWERR